jgi:hypothetical protein
MKCSECEFENREEAKFCKDCGNKLEHVCPQCGNAYTPGTKFCDECGHNFIAPSEPPPKDLSFDEKIDKLQRSCSRILLDTQGRITYSLSSKKGLLITRFRGKEDFIHNDRLHIE